MAYGIVEVHKSNLNFTSHALSSTQESVFSWLVQLIATILRRGKFGSSFLGLF